MKVTKTICDICRTSEAARPTLGFETPDHPIDVMYLDFCLDCAWKLLLRIMVESEDQKTLTDMAIALKNNL